MNQTRFIMRVGIHIYKLKAFYGDLMTCRNNIKQLVGGSEFSDMILVCSFRRARLSWSLYKPPPPQKKDMRKNLKLKYMEVSTINNV